MFAVSGCSYRNTSGAVCSQGGSGIPLLDALDIRTKGSTRMLIGDPDSPLVNLSASFEVFIAHRSPLTTHYSRFTTKT